MSRNVTTFRSEEIVGGRLVRWAKGLPESVEEFMSKMIQKYPEVLPSHVPLAVTWGRPNWRFEFFGLGGSTGMGESYTISVGDGWWDSEFAGREFDFAAGMLASRYAREGCLHEFGSVLRLDMNGAELSGDDALDYLLDEAAKLMKA